MKTLNNLTEAEEEFSRYHERLRRELDIANWHFSVVKHISNVAKDYLQELNQSPAFWWLTRNAHMYSVLMRLNNFFGKEAKEKHLHMDSFLDFIRQNLSIFSNQAFEKRLRKEDRYDELAKNYNSEITGEKVERDKQKLRDLPIASLKAQRNRILSHINKKDIAQEVDIAKKYPIKINHIDKIIDTLHEMLNEYCLAYDFSTHSKDLTIEHGIQYIVDAVRFKLQG